MKQKQARKNYLIYPRFQSKVIAFNLGLLVAGNLFVAIQIARSFNHLSDRGIAAGIAPGHVYFKFLDFERATVFSYLGISLGLSLLLCAVVTVILSHRLAGPIVRLHTYFNEISQKRGVDVPELQFRKGDFFETLPPVINQALHEIRESRDSCDSEEAKPKKRIAAI